MKEIPLTQGKVALVDDEDYEGLLSLRWVAHRQPLSSGAFVWYALRRVGTRSLYLHRQLLGEPSARVDHKNGDGLDCRRLNLRLATYAQNNANLHRQRPGKSSHFLGVFWERRRSRWVSRIRGGPADRRGHRATIHLGSFVTEEEAALAYDAAAKLYHGAFASPNFPGATE